MSIHSSRRPWFLRPAPVLSITAVFLVLGAGMVITGWVILPRMAPAWTIANSPFYGPAFTAALNGRGPAFLDRVDRWRSAALADAALRLSGPDAEAASLAIEVVAKLDPPDAAEILSLGITQPDSRVLRDIVYHLSKRNPNAHIPALIAALPNHTDDYLFDAALEIATWLNEEQFHLTEPLRTSSVARDRALAASLVCHLKNPDAVPFIISQVGQYAAEHKAAELVWDPTVIALAQNRSEAALQCLRGELSSADAKRRRNAMWAIYAQGLRDESVELAVLPCLEDPDVRVAGMAVQTFLSRRSPTALEGYERLLTRDLPVTLVLQQYGWSPTPEHLPILIRHLDHAKYGPEIMNAVLPYVIDSDQLLDQVTDLLSRMPVAQREKLVPRSWNFPLRLTDEQQARFNRIQSYATPSTVTAPTAP